MAQISNELSLKFFKAMGPLLPAPEIMRRSRRMDRPAPYAREIYSTKSRLALPARNTQLTNSTPATFVATS
jgi:hypothetical protein